MAKKNLTKTAEQRRKLEAFFSKRQSNWQKDQVIAVGRASGLTRQQVYKWLWDRKRAHLHTIKREATETPVFAPANRQLSYLSYRLEVPVNKQQASLFYVHPSVSVWVILVLKSQGWQLIRDAPHFNPHQNASLPHRSQPIAQASLQRAPLNNINKHCSSEQIFESEP